MYTISKAIWKYDSEVVLELMEQLVKELADKKSRVKTLRLGKILQDIIEHQDTFVSYLAKTEDNEPVAVVNLMESVSVYANGRYGIISEIYVKPGCRKDGIGRMLIEKAIQHGKKKDWNRIEITAPLGDHAIRSVIFYENMGFTHSGPRLKLLL
jgi:GNAT superfamily N-acetyltransferase